MHIPDGLMSPEVLVIGWIGTLIFVGLSLRKISGKMDEKTIPFMAVLGAGIFVAQMINFPVGGGTTGHLLGAALATVLLGPWGAVLVLTVILIIQSLVFGDGGLTALGLNVLNMAVIAPAVAWLTLNALDNYKNFSIPLAAWASVFVAAVVCAAQLALSYGLSGGAYGIEAVIAFPTMMGYHLVIGVGEAIITVGVVAYLAKVAPETLSMRIEAEEVSQ